MKPPKVPKTLVRDGAEDSEEKRLDGKLTLLNGVEVKVACGSTTWFGEPRLLHNGADGVSNFHPSLLIHNFVWEWKVDGGFWEWLDSIFDCLSAPAIASTVRASWASWRARRDLRRGRCFCRVGWLTVSSPVKAGGNL